LGLEDVEVLRERGLVRLADAVGVLELRRLDELRHLLELVPRRPGLGAGWERVGLLRALADDREQLLPDLAELAAAATSAGSLPVCFHCATPIRTRASRSSISCFASCAVEPV